MTSSGRMRIKKKNLTERPLSKGEDKEKERIVKGMKKGAKGFKNRYGDDYKSVMYATATKLAKEETETVGGVTVMQDYDDTVKFREYETIDIITPEPMKGVREEMEPSDSSKKDQEDANIAKKNAKELRQKDKRVNVVKRQVLMKKMQAVRQGAGADIVAGYEPEGEELKEYSPNVTYQAKGGRKSGKLGKSSVYSLRDKDESKKEFRKSQIKDIKGGYLKTEGSLHKWFKGSKSKDGKGGWVNVVTGGTCASDEPGEGTPKCVSSSKRASMSKAERLSASRRKKKADPGQQSKSGAAKPTYVATDKKKKVDECWKTHKKVGMKMKGGKMVPDCRPKNEEVEIDEACWKGYEKKGMKTMFGKRYPNCVKKKATRKEEVVAERLGGKGYKPYTSMSGEKVSGDWEDSDRGAGNKAKKRAGETVKKKSPTYLAHVHNKGKKTVDPKKNPVVEMHDTPKNVKKIAKELDKAVEMHKSQAKRLRKAGISEDKNCGCGQTPCKTYGKKEVAEAKSPAWQRKAGKNPEGGLNQKGVDSYRAANPGSKLKTAVTTKPSKLKKGSKSAKRRKSFCARMKGMKSKLTSAKTARDPDSRINKSLRKWNCEYEPQGNVIDEAKVDKGRSDYGKASIRNYRRSGPGHGEPAMFDPENKRGKLIDKRREEHKARRGVKGAKVPAYKLGEEGYDRMRDDRLVKYGIGHDGSDRKGSSNYIRKPDTPEQKKRRQAASDKAYNSVVASLKKKYGDGVMVRSKKIRGGKEVK